MFPFLWRALHDLFSLPQNTGEHLPLGGALREQHRRKRRVVSKSYKRQMNLVMMCDAQMWVKQFTHIQQKALTMCNYHCQNGFYL